MQQLISQEPADLRGHVCTVTRSVEQAGRLMLDEIARTTDRRCHNRYARSHALLHDLAEGLQLTWSHENVHAGDCGREVPAGEPTGESCLRHQTLECHPARPISNDDHGCVGGASESFQQVSILLWCKSPYEAHDLAVTYVPRVTK